MTPPPCTFNNLLPCVLTMVHVILVSTFLLINYLVTDKQINIRIVTNNKSKCSMSKVSLDGFLGGCFSRQK